MKTSIIILLATAITDLFFFLASTGHVPILTDGGSEWRSLGSGSIALVTFFGLLVLGCAKAESASISESSNRTAFAGSIFILYLVVIATSAFYNTVKDKVDPAPLQRLTETMLQSFTTIIGIVVAFYFGSSAFVEVHGKRDSKITKATGEAK
jgi:hypothetical protein